MREGRGDVGAAMAAGNGGLVAAQLWLHLRPDLLGDDDAE